MSEKSAIRCVLAAVALVLTVAGAQADVFNMPAGQTSMQMVTVGDPGNLPNSDGSGAISYSYSIGQYLVTNAQYCQFLNAKLPDITDAYPGLTSFLPSDQYGLYNTGMSAALTHPNNPGIAYDPSAATGQKFSPIPGRDNWPVIYVNWEQAIRFINWLQNGQGNGDTESGTYLITNGGQSTGAVAGFDTNTLRAYETPSAAGHWVLPTQDEWYKAAYYKGGGTNSGYWLYPTSHDTIPSYYPPGTPGADPTNSANYYQNSPPGYPKANNQPTPVGAYPESVSPYGALDMGGNASEWTETMGAGYAGGGGMLLLGGNCNLSVGELSSGGGLWHGGEGPATLDNFGFRVAYVPDGEVPEPGSLVMLAVVAVAGLLYRWRVIAFAASSATFRIHSSEETFYV